MTIFKVLKIKGLLVDYVRVIYTLCSYGNQIAMRIKVC